MRALLIASTLAVGWVSGRCSVSGSDEMAGGVAEIMDAWSKRAHAIKRGKIRWRVSAENWNPLGRFETEWVPASGRTDLAVWWCAHRCHKNSQRRGPAVVTCYMGFQGVGFTAAPDPPDGLFERTPSTPIRFRDILDGTSNVMATGERSPSYTCWCAWAAANGLWICTEYGMNEVQGFYPVPPGDIRCTEGAAYGAVSLHPGGMNTTFADGSVHSLADTMDMEIYRHIGHHRDGLPVGGAPH